MLLKEKKYGVLDLIKLPMRCAKISGSFIFIKQIISGLLPTLYVLMTARFINTAIEIVGGNAPITDIYMPMALLVTVVALRWLMDVIFRFADIRMSMAFRKNYRSAIMEKIARLSYKHIESGEAWDLILRVSKDPDTRIGDAYKELLQMVTMLMEIGGLVAVIISVSWQSALIITAFTIPLFYISLKGGKDNYDTEKLTSKQERKYKYFTELLKSREAADERALFGFTDEINKRFKTEYEEVRKIRLSVQAKWFIRSKAGSLIVVVICLLIMVTLINPLLSGALSVGLYISLVTAVSNQIQTMSWTLSYVTDRLAQNIEYMKDITAFTALSETEGATDMPDEKPPVFQSLEFRDVRFKYPFSDSMVLDGLSFRVEKGKTYAFVGINGAGKTTVTKLLTGLYDEYEGDILINGKDIKTYSQAQLKAFFSVAYQDFARYYITIRENIALGDVNRIGDNGSDINRAVEMIGLDETIEKLPGNMDTFLGKIKEGGADISGGEWQRVALARALVNPAQVRILDEPTSALDPVSESRLYETFENLSRGKTTILISHRLGSTVLSDEIFVIEGGRVTEKGSHDSLMKINGAYAGMYESQRSWYK